MRIYNVLTADGGYLYLGTKEDIKAMYKSIARNKNTAIVPKFGGSSPKFTKEVYGLLIDKRNWMSIINPDTFALMALGDELQLLF